MNKTLALTIGLTAGAVVAALARGRNVKKVSGTTYGQNYAPITRSGADFYDDSEMCYI